MRGYKNRLSLIFYLSVFSIGNVGCEHVTKHSISTDKDTEVGADEETSVGADTDNGLPAGTPLQEAPSFEWTWVPFEETYCRDGSQAGLSVRYSDNGDNLLIFLEGGGACFNNATCSANPAGISDGGRQPGYSEGIFDFNEPRNPFNNWNVVYIPYCTGDIHMGSNPDGYIPDVGPQMFVGGDNYRIFLSSIVPTFPGVKLVLLAGFSAGSIGTQANAHITTLAFGDSPKYVGISDAAAVMRDEYVTPCLQRLLAEHWKLEDLIPNDCTGCFPTQGGSLFEYYRFVVDRLPRVSSGLISSLEDITMRTFLSYGMNHCDGMGVYSGDMYREGLEDLRDYFDELEMKGGTYYYSGTSHGKLGYNNFYDTMVNGVYLVDWVNSIIEGQAVSHVSP